ncbi:MAG: class B sortase [Oscillospiraceae bacterium]
MLAKHKKLIIIITLCVIGALCVGGAVYAISTMAAKEKEYSEGENEYDSLREAALKPGTDEAEKGKQTVDVKALKEKNSDCVGWIELVGTDVSYPLLQGATNDTYLRTTFEKKPNVVGSIFVDTRCKGDFTGTNTLIYGHNAGNKSMFSILPQYAKPEFAKEHTDIKIYKEDIVLTYKVFSSRKTDVFDTAYTYTMQSNDDAVKFLLKQDELAGENDVELKGADTIITLSTCTNGAEDGRYIVQAVLTDTKPIK